MQVKAHVEPLLNCHNPYFSRWFSAIEEIKVIVSQYMIVTILILVDGFLQLKWKKTNLLKS